MRGWIVLSNLFLQVDELDLSKVKATELLRSHEGDASKAVKAFITPTVKV